MEKSSEKLLERVVKLGVKNNLERVKLGDLEVVFGEKMGRNRKRRPQAEAKAVEALKKQTLVDEMRIMDPLAYEESLISGESSNEG